MHPQHQCLKLRLRGICAFSTHLESGGALASASWGNLLEFQCGDGNCPPDFVRLAGQVGQLRKNGAVGLSVRRSESVLLERSPESKIRNCAYNVWFSRRKLCGCWRNIRLTPNQGFECQGDSGSSGGCLLVGEVPSAQSVAAVASNAQYRVVSTRLDGGAA